MIIPKTFTQSLQPVPRTYIGKAAASVLKKIEAKRILVLISPSIASSTTYSGIRETLAGRLCGEERIEGCEASAIRELAGHYRDSKVDCLVAIGGGSVIDTAKLLRIMLEATDPAMPLAALVERAGEQCSTPLIAVPTTPATGSEVSSIAVAKEAKKIPYVSQALIPSIAVLDPVFMTTIPPEQMAAFSADIFSHCYESYFSKLANTLVKAYALEALELLKQGMIAYHDNHQDIKALEQIMCAGHLAGISQTNAFVGVCHALGHSLETINGTPHSKAMQLLVWKCMAWHKQQGQDNKIFMDAYSALSIEAEPGQLSAIDTQAWAAAALEDPSIKTNPITMNKEKLLDLIQWITRR